jgi:hypothetical protein
MPRTGCITPSQFNRIQFKEVRNMTGQNKADYIEYCERTEFGRQLLSNAGDKITLEILKGIAAQIPGELQPMAGTITYAEELVLDILGVEPREEVTAASLEHGIENEPYAIQRYTLETMYDVRQVSDSIPHPKYNFVWGRPDGLIGDSGGIEVKCPWNPLWHLHNFKGKGVQDYYDQIQGYMWITGREWWDFVSYDPHFPYPQQIIIKTVERDEAFIADLEKRCLMFWDLVQKILQEYK